MEMDDILTSDTRRFLKSIGDIGKDDKVKNLVRIFNL